MPKIMGRHNGCETCRSLRVKCDNAKPECRKCIDQGRKCAGYERQEPFMTPSTPDSGRASSHPGRSVKAAAVAAHDARSSRVSEAAALPPSQAWGAMGKLNPSLQDHSLLGEEEYEEPEALQGSAYSAARSRRLRAGPPELQHLAQQKVSPPAALPPFQKMTSLPPGLPASEQVHWTLTQSQLAAPLAEVRHKHGGSPGILATRPPKRVSRGNSISEEKQRAYEKHLEAFPDDEGDGKLPYDDSSESETDEDANEEDEEDVEDEIILSPTFMSPPGKADPIAQRIARGFMESIRYSEEGPASEAKKKYEDDEENYDEGELAADELLRTGRKNDAMEIDSTKPHRRGSTAGKRTKMEVLRRKSKTENDKHKDEIIRQRSAPKSGARPRRASLTAALSTRSDPGKFVGRPGLRSSSKILETREANDLTVMAAAVQMAAVAGQHANASVTSLLTDASAASKSLRRMKGTQELRADEKHHPLAETVYVDGKRGKPEKVMMLAIPRRQTGKSKPRRPLQVAPEPPTIVLPPEEDCDDDHSADYDYLTMSDVSDDGPTHAVEESLLPLFKDAVQELLSQWTAWRAHQGKNSGQGSQPKGKQVAGSRGGKGSSSRPSKRPSPCDEEDAGDRDEDDDDDELRPTRVPKKHKSINETGRMLACPFWKFDPHGHRDCYRKILSQIRYVKSHLYRFHETPLFCYVCGERFQEEEAQFMHGRAQACQRRDFVPPGGMTRAQRMLIQRRADPKAGDEENWFRIWDILFPGYERPPSAYIDTQLSEDLVSFREFYTVQGLDMLQRLLRSGGNPAYVRTEEDERAILRMALEQIYQSWTERYHGGNVANGRRPTPNERRSSAAQRRESAQDVPPRSSISNPSNPSRSMPTSMRGSLSSSQAGPSTMGFRIEEEYEEEQEDDDEEEQVDEDKLCNGLSNGDLVAAQGEDVGEDGENHHNLANYIHVPVPGTPSPHSGMGDVYINIHQPMVTMPGVPMNEPRSDFVDLPTQNGAVFFLDEPELRPDFQAMFPGYGWGHQGYSS